ncbi:type I glutamate--ammonia ligase [Candidatus Woesearchaeota archaeon]|nr:type I glutamate--ammonia ligase [Candidatus Woesearchaeota archaeon]
MEIKEIHEIIAKENVKFIEMEFTDIFGVLKSIEIPIECLKDAVEKGLWFDGSSIKGFTRIKESDMYLKPDLSTFAIIPDDKEVKTARFFCDVYTSNGELFAGTPRTVLKKVIEEAKKEGYVFKVGPEVEFYFFKKTADGKIAIPDSDDGSYFDSPTGDIGSEIRKEVMLKLKAYGIHSERAHHEVGHGQHEIGFRYDDALVTAERVITLKKIIKMVAHKYGLIASFMPKPLFKKPGSGMHIHFSLFDLDGKPLFYNEEDKYKLSPLAKSFIAGQLSCIKEMSAILNPTVNSYKRLVSGYEAPVYICWGGKNRSALIRIPHYTKGRESSVRAEIRCPDPSASPYLAFAALLKVGLEGIKKKKSLMPSYEENIFEQSKEELEKIGIETLPESLSDALKIFKKSDLMKELLGDKLFGNYLYAKEKECEEFRIAVTDWEVNTYL